MTRSLRGEQILIIGSGISGLVLAQILRKAGVEFEVFERDSGMRAQGWSVGLDKCLPYLEGLLPDDLEPFEVASANYGLERDDGFAIMDGQSHKILGMSLLSSKAGTNYGMFVSRNRLRGILSKHLNIQYNKQFLEYEADQDGVIVRFKDGSTSKGTILVGSDGASSSVRSQLLPGFRAIENQHTMLNGNVMLPKDVYDPVLEHSGCGILAASPGLKFYLLLEQYLEDGAKFSWNCSWRGADWEADHVWSQDASPEDLLQRALKELQHFPEYILRAVKMTRPNGMQKPPIRLLETVLPDEGLPNGRVTLVGDSAHSMVPFRGMGANTAIIDACELGRGIIDVVRTGGDVLGMLRKYAETMVPRGRTNVLESRATGESMDAREVAGGRI